MRIMIIIKNKKHKNKKNNKPSSVTPKSKVEQQNPSISNSKYRYNNNHFTPVYSSIKKSLLILIGNQFHPRSQRTFLGMLPIPKRPVGGFNPFERKTLTG